MHHKEDQEAPIAIWFGSSFNYGVYCDSSGKSDDHNLHDQIIPMKKKSVTSILFPFLLFVPFLLISCAESPPENVARVGSREISREEISYRSQLQEAFGGEKLPAQTALVAVINDALAESVATTLGLVPSWDELYELKVTEETSERPEVLQRIREVFDNDSMTYYEHYLKPRVVEAKLQRYQAYDTGAQNEAGKRIRQAYDLIANGKSFAEAAAETGGMASRDTFAVGQKDSSLIEEQNPQSGLRHPIAVLAEQHLKPGEIFPQVVEDNQAYRIVRLIARNQERNIVETIAIPKQTYATWLKSKAEGIPVIVYDKNLADSVKGTHSTIWWVPQINVE